MSATIRLTNGLIAVVDDSDEAALSSFRWRAHLKRDGRVVAVAARRQGKTFLMHRILMAVGDRNVFVDHINGDPLDNRRINLRLATNAENLRNRKTHCNNASGYKGVYFRPDRKKYVAQIKHSGKKYELGSFPTAEEAHSAYCRKALELHGEFARFS